MEKPDHLPIRISIEESKIPSIMSAMAQRAFALGNYDMSPDDAVNTAIKRGLLIIEQPAAVANPMPIRRMPGNGSFA